MDATTMRKIAAMCEVNNLRTRLHIDGLVLTAAGPGLGDEEIETNRIISWEDIFQSSNVVHVVDNVCSEMRAQLLADARRLRSIRNRQSGFEQFKAATTT